MHWQVTTSECFANKRKKICWQRLKSFISTVVTIALQLPGSLVSIAEEAPQETEQVLESPTNEFKAGDKKVALEEFNSSIIKFCLAEATPYRKK